MTPSLPPISAQRSGLALWACAPARVGSAFLRAGGDEAPSPASHRPPAPEKPRDPSRPIKTSPVRWRTDARILRLLLPVAAALFGGPGARAIEVEAVASKASPDYVRKKLPDGTFQPETYVFGKGDDWRGARVDATIDKMDFIDVARVLAVPLAEKRYLPTEDPKTTNDLIMVYWGTTRAPEHASESNSYQLLVLANNQLERAIQEVKTMQKQAATEILAEADNALLAAQIGVQAESQRREDTDMRNATLLGYDSWWIATNSAMGGTPLGLRRADMETELEEDRYFVVLTAFDYQMLVKQKKQKFLWEVRFSIRERRNQFDKRLADMAATASQYFGRDSGGLNHITLPEGHVEIGPVRSLGILPSR
jgi:hypothetical protein